MRKILIVLPLSLVFLTGCVQTAQPAASGTASTAGTTGSPTLTAVKTGAGGTAVVTAWPTMAMTEAPAGEATPSPIATEPATPTPGVDLAALMREKYAAFMDYHTNLPLAKDFHLYGRYMEDAGVRFAEFSMFVQDLNGSMRYRIDFRNGWLQVNGSAEDIHIDLYCDGSTLYMQDLQWLAKPYKTYQPGQLKELIGVSFDELLACRIYDGTYGPDDLEELHSDSDDDFFFRLDAEKVGRIVNAAYAVYMEWPVGGSNFEIGANGLQFTKRPNGFEWFEETPLQLWRNNLGETGRIHFGRAASYYEGIPDNAMVPNWLTK
jgi:hypothetical protein